MYTLSTPAARAADCSRRDVIARLGCRHHGEKNAVVSLRGLLLANRPRYDEAPYNQYVKR